MPKKSKAPLVVVLTAGLLLLGGAGTAALFYFDAHEDRGTRYTGDKLPELCGKVPETRLAEARTTNPNGKMSSEREVSNKTTVTNCDWRQTLGRDGDGLRSLTIVVEKASDSDKASSNYDRISSQVKANTQGELQVKELSGLGEEATVVLMVTKSAFTQINIVVRQGDHVVNVDYTGWDVGLFSRERPDIPAFEEMAKAVTADLIAKL